MKNCLLIFLLLNLKTASLQLKSDSEAYFFTKNIPESHPTKLHDAEILRYPNNTSSPTPQVLINEIFANPSHAIGLPSVEFIELWNPSNATISLKNWQYSDAVSTYKFGNDSIKANEYLILCPKADTAKFKPYGRVIGLSAWPTLNNTGDQLSLKNEQGVLIDRVNYSDTWYKDAVKKQGGWSLERIDPQAVCSGGQNWSASTHPSGGTPGQQNSVYKTGTQTGSFQLVNAQLTDSVTVLLTFNRFADSFSAANTANYTLNNGLGSPIKAIPVGPDFLQVNLQFANPVARGKTYKITLSQVSDCAGYLITAPFNSIEFSLPEKICKGDILINEVLFNPLTDGVDFVEIVNNSTSVLDLSELYLANLSKDSLSNLKRVNSQQHLFKPGEYLVLTTDPEKVKQKYHTENPNAFLKMASLPAYNNASGNVILWSNGLRIDQLDYTEKMHFPMIKNPKGVSLERSSRKRPTNDPGNFRSAAASVGFATPGYKNSQYLDEPPLNEEFSLLSKTFSPDNDGFEDQLQINYRLDKPGYVANIHIYNDKGILVRKLCRNLTLALEGSINWDGLNDFAELAPTGIYLIHAELFNLDGQVKTFRKTCVLASKFN